MIVQYSYALWNVSPWGNAAPKDTYTKTDPLVHLGDLIGVIAGYDYCAVMSKDLKKYVLLYDFITAPHIRNVDVSSTDIKTLYYASYGEQND